MIAISFYNNITRE